MTTKKIVNKIMATEEISNKITATEESTPNQNKQGLADEGGLFVHKTVVEPAPGMRQKDEQFMRKALAEAEMALDEGEIPIGAVIVCRDRVIARAHNLTETLCDVTAHAEMQAITAAAAQLGGKYLTECTLYVTVEPCTMCAGAIGWAQIPRIVYGASDEKRGYSEYAPHAFHPRATVTGGVLPEECARLMKMFFKEKRGKS